MKSLNAETLLNDYEASLAVAKRSIENAQHNAVRLRRELGLVSTGANQKKQALSEESLIAVITKRRTRMARNGPMTIVSTKKKSKKSKAS